MSSHMKMARASDKDREAVTTLVSILEAIDSYGGAEIDGHDWEPDDAQLGGWLRDWLENHAGALSRVVWGYETLVDNVCDPKLSHLEWRPDIKAALEKAGIE